MREENTMPEDTLNLQIDDWVVRVRNPSPLSSAPVYLLVHGWTGDETVMWLFANRLPSHFLMVAPRAPYSTPLGGYGWQPSLNKPWPTVIELEPLADRLLVLLDRLKAHPETSAGDFNQVHLLGFSQGAAVCYTLALTHPERVRSIAGLAGFLPDGAAKLVDRQPLRGLPVFVAHGSQDDTVPVARARQSVELLESAGGKVTYCEEDVGHKLSAACFRALQSFADGLVQPPI